MLSIEFNIVNKYKMKLTLGPDKYKTDFDFFIPETDHIGILASGGLDSAILICLIIEELKRTNRLDSTKISTYTVLKFDGAMAYAARNIEWIENHYNIKLDVNNNIENNDMSAGRVSKDSVAKLMQENPNTVFYIGANHQADPSVKTFKHNLKIKVPYTETEYLKFPFLNMIKPNMVNLYFQFSVRDLISYTHSCTASMTDFCYDCYACEERAWAFEELNINPTFIPIDKFKLTWFPGGQGWY